MRFPILFPVPISLRKYSSYSLWQSRVAPLILITTPILFPVVVRTLGMDPVQFGIMMMLNLGIGLCTPPVGSALFVGCAVGKISIEKASRAMIPFYLAMVVTLLLITFVPQIVMFVPNLLMPQ